MYGGSNTFIREYKNPSLHITKIFNQDMGYLLLINKLSIKILDHNMILIYFISTTTHLTDPHSISC